ncbi:MAG TPA: hypothetical protein VGI14_01070 [Casimicrobiaceae bacterium]
MTTMISISVKPADRDAIGRRCESRDRVSFAGKTLDPRLRGDDSWAASRRACIGPL